MDDVAIVIFWQKLNNVLARYVFENRPCPRARKEASAEMLSYYKTFVGVGSVPWCSIKTSLLMSLRCLRIDEPTMSRVSLAGRP